MSDLGYAAKIWIAERSSSQVVLAPSLEDGVPEPLSPAVSLFRASYVSVAEAQADLLTQAGSILQDTYATLAVRFLSPDGPPNQVLILFDPGGKEQITYRVGSRAHDKVPCDAYRVCNDTAGPAMGFRRTGRRIRAFSRRCISANELMADYPRRAG